MKKLAFVVAVMVLGVSQVQAAVMVRSLQCTEPTLGGQARVGVSFSVGAISRSAISGSGTDYFLGSRVVAPGAELRKEKLAFVNEQNGWLTLAGSNATVHVNKEFTAAKVDFDDGYSSLCQ